MKTTLKTEEWQKADVPLTDHLWHHILELLPERDLKAARALSTCCSMEAQSLPSPVLVEAFCFQQPTFAYRFTTLHHKAKLPPKPQEGDTAHNKKSHTQLQPHIPTGGTCRNSDPTMAAWHTACKHTAPPPRLTKFILRLRPEGLFGVRFCCFFASGSVWFSSLAVCFWEVSTRFLTLREKQRTAKAL